MIRIVDSVKFDIILITKTPGTVYTVHMPNRTRQ